MLDRQLLSFNDNFNDVLIQLRKKRFSSDLQKTKEMSLGEKTFNFLYRNKKNSKFFPKGNEKCERNTEKNLLSLEKKFDNMKISANKNIKEKFINASNFEEEIEINLPLNENSDFSTEKKEEKIEENYKLIQLDEKNFISPKQLEEFELNGEENLTRKLSKNQSILFQSKINSSFDNKFEMDIVDFNDIHKENSFFNYNFNELETFNTSKNSNSNTSEDLSLSFITEFTNKQIPIHLIKNAIETEKLMMKLFDICNPALQPHEKNSIILYSDMQKLKKKIREYVKKITEMNYNFSPMDLDFFYLMDNNNSFSQIYSNLINNVTNEDELMLDRVVNYDKIDDEYDFSMIID